MPRRDDQRPRAHHPDYPRNNRSLHHPKLRPAQPFHGMTGNRPSHCAAATADQGNRKRLEHPAAAKLSFVFLETAAALRISATAPPRGAKNKLPRRRIDRSRVHRRRRRLRLRDNFSGRRNVNLHPHAALRTLPKPGRIPPNAQPRPARPATHHNAVGIRTHVQLVSTPQRPKLKPPNAAPPASSRKSVALAVPESMKSPPPPPHNRQRQRKNEG